MDRGALWASVHGVANSWKQLNTYIHIFLLVIYNFKCLWHLADAPSDVVFQHLSYDYCMLWAIYVHFLVVIPKVTYFTKISIDLVSYTVDSISLQRSLSGTTVSSLIPELNSSCKPTSMCLCQVEGTYELVMWLLFSHSIEYPLTREGDKIDLGDQLFLVLHSNVENA